MNNSVRYSAVYITEYGIPNTEYFTFLLRSGIIQTMYLIRQFLAGFGALFTVTTPPLYRYPYRNGFEALRGDWLRVGKDIEAAIQVEEELAP